MTFDTFIIGFIVGLFSASALFMAGLALARAQDRRETLKWLSAIHPPPTTANPAEASSTAQSSQSDR